MKVTCPHCGEIRDVSGIAPDTVVFCSCGKPFRTPSPAPFAENPPPPARLSEEPFVPPPVDSSISPYPMPTSPASEPTTPGTAVAALILGLVSFFTCGIFFSIPGRLLAYSARKKIDESPSLYKGRDVATAGVVVNWISICLFLAVIVVGLFIAIAAGGFAALQAG